METKTGEEQVNKGEKGDLPFPPEDGPEALRRLAGQIPEILDYLFFYLRAQMDRAKFSVKKIGGYVFLGIVSLFLIIQLIYLSLHHLFLGLAEGISQRFPLSPWLGSVILGGGVFLLFLMTVLLGSYWIRRGSFRKTKKVYEHEFKEQKIKYGHSIVEQAAPTGQNGR